MPETREPVRLDERAATDSTTLPALARFTGAVAMVLGSVVLTGWLLHVEALTRVAPGLASMKLNSAVSIIALGAVLLLNPTAWRRHVTVGAVVIVACLTLVEYAFGVALGIDEVLVRDMETGAPHPGRMAVTTALCFLVLALAMYHAPRRRPRLCQGAALAACVVAWVGLLGYLFGAATLYSVGPLSTMAMHTAVGLLLLSVGFQATIPGGLLVWAVHGRDAGGFAVRHLLPVAAVGLPLIGYVRLRGEQAGWYDTELGLAIMVTASSLVFGVVVTRVAGRLTRIDAARAQALAELDSLNRDLEHRVDERTSDLEVSESWARSLATAAPIGIFHTDATGGCTFTNDRWQDIVGISAADALDQGWLSGIHPDDRPTVTVAWRRATATMTTFDAEFRGCRADGEVRWVRARAARVLDPAGTLRGYVGTLEDITETRRSEAELFHLANHDPLTGLLNRRSFEAVLEPYIARMRRGRPEGALLFLDIDHFKAVNDTHSHQTGDQVIIAAANAIRGRLRESDFIARLGGDEFAVLLPTSSGADARLVADMLVTVLRDNLAVVVGKRLDLTSSVGLAICDTSGLSADDMLLKADLAMYAAKQNGRDQWAEAPLTAPSRV